MEGEFISLLISLGNYHTVMTSFFFNFVAKHPWLNPIGSSHLMHNY